MIASVISLKRLVLELRILKGCLGKKKYPTASEAYQGGWGIFGCLRCGFWHRAKNIKGKYSFAPLKF